MTGLQKTPGGIWLADRKHGRNSVKYYPPIAGGSSRTYMALNGPASTTAQPALVAATTSLLTLQQLKTSATLGLRVIEWGVSFSSVVTSPVQVDLVNTTTVNATVTAYVAADVIKMNGPNDAATSLTLATSGSGYTSTAEGTVVAGRTADYQLVQQSYLKQFPLGREFELAISNILRVRVLGSTGNTPNVTSYIVWEE